MRWHREDMGDNSPACASAVKMYTACLGKSRSRLSARVAAAKDKLLMQALELASCSSGQPYHCCLQLGLGVLQEKGCFDLRAGEDTWKAP